MAIFITGGSNSVYKDGWVSKIDGARNLSVGANTTLCGIYRCLLRNGPAQGDTVIWEYGINEITYARHLYALDTILRNLEGFLLLARSRAWKVLPLMLVPREEELSKRLPEYYHRALQLFRHYGLETIDMSARFRQQFRAVPPTHYSDEMHLRRDESITGETGRLVQNALDHATVPSAADPLYMRGNFELLRVKASSVFKNSIMKVPLTDLPFRRRMTGNGTIRSVVAMCKGDVFAGLRIRLVRGEQAIADARVSITCRNDKVLLKAINLDNLGDWSFRPDDILSIRHIAVGGKLYAEAGLKIRLDELTPNPESPLCGVLIEREA